MNLYKVPIYLVYVERSLLAYYIIIWNSETQSNVVVWDLFCDWIEIFEFLERLAKIQNV